MMMMMTRMTVVSSVVCELDHWVMVTFSSMLSLMMSLPWQRSVWEW